MIQLAGLGKTYRTGFLMRSKAALNAVDLSVGQGEIFGFIGPNGAGKSTTIKILTGLLRPSIGTARIMGKDPMNPVSRENLGYLPEHPYFYDYLTGYELLRFYGSIAGLKGALLEERVQWALKLLHADADWIHRRLRSYSKGMMQRMGLAQAILTKPSLLILDEPMSGLDPMGRRDVREAILTLNREEGCTIFYSSHVLADVESISHRVAMVVDGRIVRQGTVDEVTASEGNQYRIRLTKNIELPIGNLISQIRTGEYLCQDAASRDQLLQLALQQGIGVEKLENNRPSLEEVLTREVAQESTHA